MNTSELKYLKAQGFLIIYPSFQNIFLRIKSNLELLVNFTVQEEKMLTFVYHKTVAKNFSTISLAIRTLILQKENNPFILFSVGRVT